MNFSVWNQLSNDSKVAFLQLLLLDH